MAKSFLKAPPLLLEYVYYAVFFIETFSLVSIPFLEIGGYSAVAVLCVMHFGKMAILVYRPIALGFGCAVSLVLVQFVIHEESLFGQTNLRDFITWAVCLVVVQSLSMRKGFFHRFAIFAFFVGLGTLPFIQIVPDDTLGLTRVTLEKGIGLGTANGLGMWFGFCLIYFLIAGLEARQNLVRIAAWGGGGFCFFMMGITVSRAPLIGSVMAATLAFKRVLKRSFLPVIGFLFVGWIVYVTGLADNIINYYLTRGSVETGRAYVWRVGLDRFLDSWLGGVGLSNVNVLRPGALIPTSPHNGFLFIGLSSGVVPLAFFIGYIWYAARGAFQSRKEKSGNAPYLLPMFLFCMLEVMVLGLPFMSPWFMVVISTIFSERNYLHLGPKTGNKTYPESRVYGSPPNSSKRRTRPKEGIPKI